MPPTPEIRVHVSHEAHKRGVRTTEFWLSLALLGLLTASALLGLDLDALNATLAVIGYTVSRSAAKLLPPIIFPPPPPPPEGLIPPILIPPPPPPPPSVSDEVEVSG